MPTSLNRALLVIDLKLIPTAEDNVGDKLVFTRT
jgi:hypothetical protein